jgi:hypothetical protein
VNRYNVRWCTGVGDASAGLGFNLIEMGSDCSGSSDARSDVRWGTGTDHTDHTTLQLLVLALASLPVHAPAVEVVEHR